MHFKTPKLELLQSVVPSIMWLGALPQWSADVTERLHIDFIKAPKDNTNNHDYYSQICCHLNRDKKHHHFGLTTAIHAAAVNIDIPPLHPIPSSHRIAGPDWIFNVCDDNGNSTDWKLELPQVTQTYGPPLSGNVALGVTLQSDLEGILNLKAFSCRYTSTLTNPSKPD